MPRLPRAREVRPWGRPQARSCAAASTCELGQPSNHPTSFIDPSGFDGYYFDFNMNYSFDFSPDFQGFDFSNPNMGIGTGGYYTPDVQMSVGTPDMTYAGGQYYLGETGNLGGAASFSPEQYYSYLASQYGAGTADLMTHNGVDVFHNPVPSWYPNDSTLQWGQNACLAIAAGCALASGVGALMEMGIGGLGTGLSMSSLATPQGITMGTSVLGAAGQYSSQNAGEISTMASEFGSEANVAAEGGGLASDAINGARLAQQLAYEEASSAFTATGELSPGAIQSATQIFRAGELGNPAIPEGFAKFTTDTFASPSGPFQAHFYMNPESGVVFYGLDYKVIFNLGVQPFTPAIGIVP